MSLNHKSWLSMVTGLVFFIVPTVNASPLKSVAQRMTKGLSGLSSKKVAVMTFLYPNGGTSSGSSIIAEQLTTLLVSCKGIQVIERSLLPKVLEEIKLENTGITDAATTQKLGRILGVDAIVTGWLNDLDDNRTEVNARLIQTETGSILAAAEVEVERTWKDDPILNTAIKYQPEKMFTPKNVPALTGSGSWNSPDNRRMVQVYGNKLEAFLYDTSSTGPVFMKCLGNNVEKIRFFGGTEHKPLRIITESKDEFSVFSENGDPVD